VIDAALRDVPFVSNDAPGSDAGSRLETELNNVVFEWQTV
jgi:hypothetical protein